MVRSSFEPARVVRITLVVVAVVGLGGAPLVVAGAARAEAAVAPERNPPGDIPDSQVFVTYANTAGYSLKVPEGWARSEAGPDVQFADKYDTVSVTLQAQNSPLSREMVRKVFVPALEQVGHAVQVLGVEEVALPAGPAIRVRYSANSEPNPVTGKQVRLEANRYLLFHAGKLATLDLLAPYGADNVDQWRLMAQSFRWK